MVRGYTDIYMWFQNTAMPYWRVYAHKNIQSGNVIMQSRQEEGRSHGDGLEELQHKLKVLNRGTFTLVAYPTPERLPTKGYHFTDIEITNEKTAEPMQISGPVGLSESEVTRRIDEALTAYKTKEELADLKKKVTELERENKELKGSVDAPMNKFLGAIAPYSDRIVGHFFPQQANVAGFPQPSAGPEDSNIIDAEVIDNLSPEELAVQKFVDVLSANDPGWVQTLQQLTTAIQGNPSLIGMVKKFI